MPNFGDRPNFPLPSQRLDKVDVEAISELVEASLMRLFGSIMGPSYGLLSDVELTWDIPTTTLTVGRCALGYSKLDSGSVVTTAEYGVEGGVVRHDPAQGSQSTIQFTEGAFSTGYIFFKPVWPAADEENRAYWDGLSKQKKVGLANTRLRERITLTVDTVGNLSTRIAAGEFPFLYIQGWETNEPALVRIHYFESGVFAGGAYDLLFQRGDTAPAVQSHTDIGEAFNTFQARGLAQITRAQFATLCKIMDSDWTFTSAFATTQEGAVGWNSAPTMGLKQIQDYIDATVEAKVIAELNTRERILWWGKVVSSAITEQGGDYLAYATGAVTCATNGSGTFTIDFTDAWLTSTALLFAACSHVLDTGGVARAEYVDGSTIQVITKNSAGADVDRDFKVFILGTSTFIPDITP